MAISQTYCDFATGNDYSGATFTDGAYTSATKTLVKAGAFAKTKVNHWLYLESNDGGSIVAGYYKVASVPDANTVTLATDAGNGTDDDAAKCVQHDGTTTKPWRSVQGALDLITRDSTNGDQVNIKDTQEEVLAATLVLTTYGAPTEGVPLIFRGYTTTANDGGRAHLTRAGDAIYSEGRDYLVFADLILEGGGNPAKLISVGNDCSFYNVTFVANKGIAAVAYGLTAGSNVKLIGCESSGPFANTFTIASGLVFGCYFHGSYVGVEANGYAVIQECIFLYDHGTNRVVGSSSDNLIVLNNVFYSTGALTFPAVVLGNYSGRQNHVAMNNIICGHSGVGGGGISSASGADVVLVGHNAFYNNTTNYSIGGDLYLTLATNDVALAADPFTDAANGDFSLTAAAKTALAAKGFPTSYLGLAAGTVPNITIGAIQQALASGGGGGFPKIASLLGRTRM